MSSRVRRFTGILILIVNPFVTATVGLAAFFGSALLTSDPRLLCLAGFAAAAVAAFALAVPGWALLCHRRRRSRALFACLVVALCAGCFTGTVLVPGSRPAAGPAPSWVNYWTLPTGSRLAYAYRQGQGEPRPHPVVFLHGGPGTPGEGLPGVATELAADGFDVYSYDQLGAGRSTRLSDVTGYTVARQVADLDAIRVLLHADRLILVGQSWGASLAAQYAAAHPDRVKKAVFTSPGPIWPKAWPGGGTGDPWARLAPPQRRQRDALLSRPRILASAILQEVNPNAAHRFVGDDEADEFFHRLAVIGKDATNCPGAAPARVHDNHQGYYTNQITSADFDSIDDPRPVLRRADFPTLIMRGHCDFVPWEVAREYRDLLPGAVLVAVAGAGHGIASAQPSVYIRTLQAFLTDRPLPLPPYTSVAAPSA